MTKKLLGRLSRLLLGPVTKVVLGLMGFYTLFWGLWVASPFWSVFNQAGLYSQLAGVAPECFWGVLAILSGVGVLWGAGRMSVNSLLLGSSVGWIHWLIIAIMYFWGDWQSTGGLTSLFIAFYFAYVYLNVKIKTTGKEHLHLDEVLCD